MRRIAPMGFTMIELLLALLLTSFLTAALSMMLGQAARDRRAMQEPTSDPPWAVAAFDVIERDLRHAHWWAGTDDRVVLIGLGRDGRPAQIEYTWRDTSEQAAWVRQTTPLTAPGQSDPKPRQHPVAVGLSGLMIGPHRFGNDLTEYSPDTLLNPRTSTSIVAEGDPRTASLQLEGVSIVVAGKQVPLRTLPDQVDLALAAADEPKQVVTRKVVLR